MSVLWYHHGSALPLSITSRRACASQEKVQGLVTQVQQLQEQLEKVQLENVHDAAQLQVCLRCSVEI